MHKIIQTVMVVLVLVCGSITLTACRWLGFEPLGTGSSSSSEAEFLPGTPYTVGDMEFTEAPASVVSLSPALTEIVSELGFLDKLSGRSDYCDYPAEVKALPGVGSSANPDLQAILQLKPQLLISQSPLASSHISQLEKGGVRVLILPAPKSVNQLKADCLELATLFNGPVGAEDLAKKLMSPLENLLNESPRLKNVKIPENSLLSGGESLSATESKVAGAPENSHSSSSEAGGAVETTSESFQQNDVQTPENSGNLDVENTTFVYLMTAELAVATGDTLAGELLSYYAKNVADGGQDYAITPEDLLKADPDLIFLDKNLAPESDAAQAIDEKLRSQLTAFKSGKVYAIDNRAFERPTPRLLAEVLESFLGQM